MKNLYLLFILLSFLSTKLNAQNTAILLDGISEHLTIPHNDNQNIGDAFTIEAWIYANNWASEVWRGSIVNKDNQGPDRGFAFRCGDNGKLSFVIAVDNSWEETMTTSVMSTKQWHHVAGVVNGTTVKLYVDGQEVAAGSFDGSPSDLPQDLLIGASYFDGRFFDGAIDEVRIWNVARTQQEISENADADLMGTESGLAVYLPMNEGSGMLAGNIADAAFSAAGVGIDDSNWIEGYSLPEFDLTLRSLANIDLLNAKTRPQKITIDVQNVGLQDMTDFDISIDLDGTEVFTETINQTVISGELITVEMKTPLDLTQNTSPEITARLSHPDDANTLNNTFQVGFINSQDNRVNLYSLEQHNFGGAGQNKGRVITLPADLSEYSQILMHLNLSCPSGGCDPWDQPAQITASHDGRNFEIARYITPYGIACGNWTIDVTDFKSIFHGQTQLNSYIQVWGPNGWLLDADLEFIEGDHPAPHSMVSALWSDDYVVYGDPGVSHDLAVADVSSNALSEFSHMRMHITGHGQGNTFNAAEFYEVTHAVEVNGAEIAEDYLWKSDCADNACEEQAGNWLFPRAGWCPGQEVQPRIFETTDMMGGEMTFDYVLADYTNLLNTGYNSSGHTEPHYRIHGSFIEESATRYFTYNNLSIDIEHAEISGNAGSFITFNITNNGDTDLNTGAVNLFLNNELVEVVSTNVTIAPGEVYPVDYPFSSLSPIVGENIFFAELASDDDNPGDDVYRFLVDVMVGVDELYINELFSVQPNPSPQNINVNFDQELLNGQFELYSVTGNLVHKEMIESGSHHMLVQEPGTYLLKVTNANGYTGVQKIIVID